MATITAKIIKSDPLIGKYFCPSDGRTYEVTHLEKSATTTNVCGRGLDCIAGNGIIKMSTEEFGKKILMKTFIKK